MNDQTRNVGINHEPHMILANINTLFIVTLTVQDSLLSREDYLIRFSSSDG